MRIGEIIKVVCLLLGTVIGAGFVSGKEVLMFFNTFSFASLINIFVSGIAFFLVSYMFLSCRQKSNFSYFQKSKMGIGFDAIMLFFNIVSLSVLTAGLAMALGSFIAMFSVVVSLAIVFMGIKWLKNINLILLPVIIFVLLFISLSNFDITEKIIVNSRPMLVSAFIYVGMNIFFVSELLIDAGQSLSKKERFWSSFISSIIFMIILIIITLGFSYCNITISEEMPILKLSTKLNAVFSKIYLFILWAGIFTTMISVVYSIKAKVKKIFGWGSIALIGICIIAILFSRLGFGRIVSVFYPLEGMVGILYSIIVFVLIFVCEERKHQLNS